MGLYGAPGYGSTRDLLSRFDPVPQRKVPDLPPEVARSVLGELGNQTLQTVDSLFYGIDTPGAVSRSAIAAMLGGNAGNPFGNWDDRVTGSELLEMAGLAPANPKTLFGKAAKGVAGFAVEVVTDPLSLLSGPAKALTPAGKAARATGLLDTATAAASKKLLNSGAPIDNAVGKATVREFAKHSIPLTDATVSARPLVGKRISYRTQTLDDLLNAIDDPALRAQELDKLLQQVPGGMTFDELRTQKLGKTMGIGLPLGDARIAVDVLGKEGGDLLAGGMDALGQAAAWSPAGRMAGQWMNRDVAGAYDLPDQIEALRVSQKVRAAGRQAAAKGARLAVDAKFAQIPASVARQTGVSNLMSPEGNTALLRLVELDSSLWNANDQALYQVADVKRIVDYLRDQSADYIRRSAEAGVPSQEMRSRFPGIRYYPRQLTSVEMENAGRSGRGGQVFSHTTADMLRRTEAFDVPGGTAQLRQLSLDPALRQRLAISDDDAADYILQAIGPTNGVYTRDNAIALAQAFRKMPEGSLDAKLGYFGQHPVDAFSSYFAGRERAMATAMAKTEALADYIVSGRATQSAGHTSAIDALSRGELNLSLADPQNNRHVGADLNLKRMIWERMPAATRPQSALAIDLTKYSVPDHIVDRLTRTAKIAQYPEAFEKIGDMLSGITRWWKSSVLTWPSRYVRDFYSGTISNYLETGDALGMAWSYGQVRGLLQGDYDAFASRLSSLPKYRALLQSQGPEEALKVFLADVGATRVLSGTSIEDLPAAIGSGKTAIRGMPGGESESLLSISAELAPKSGRTWGEFAGDFATLGGVGGATITKNPVLRAGERLGDYVDSVNRLAGYLTLLRQGVDPHEAARRIGRAQVDYSSLTDLERRTIRAIFPFWAYQSRMSSYVAGELASRPGGRYGQMVRALHNLQRPSAGDYIPTNIREQFGFKIGEDDNNDIYLTDLDAPGIDQIATLKIGPTGMPDISKTLMGLGQMTNPLLRGLAEHVTGQNFFYRRPLGEDQSGLDRLMAAAGVTATNPIWGNARTFVNSAVSASPLSRWDSLLRNALNEKRDPWGRVTDAVVNNLTGVKRRPVEKSAEIRDADDKIRARLDRYGRDMPLWFVPEEAVGAMSPEELQQYQLHKMIERYFRERAIAKKTGESMPPLPI